MKKLSTLVYDEKYQGLLIAIIILILATLITAGMLFL